MVHSKLWSFKEKQKKLLLITQNQTAFCSPCSSSVKNKQVSRTSYFLLSYEISRIMENIVEIISEDNSQCLKELLRTRVTKKEGNILDFTIKDIEELFLFACYTSSLSCLLVLSKFGKLTMQSIF